MLVQEKQLNEYSSRAQWVLLSVAERALRNEYCMAEGTRTALRDLCANGTAGLHEMAMDLPSSTHQAVSWLPPGWARHCAYGTVRVSGHAAAA